MPCDDDSFEAVPARPRFPYVRVAATGVAFVVAAYVWMGWGYRWDVTPADLVRGAPPVPFPGGWVGRYLRVRGTTFDMARWSPAMEWLPPPTHVFDLETPKAKIGLVGDISYHEREWEFFIGRLVRIHASDRYALYLPRRSLLRDVAPRRRTGLLARLFGSRDAYVESIYREFIARTGVDPAREALVAYPGPIIAGRPRSPREPAVDTTRGRLDGMSLIALVLAFWSGVFLHLWLADWRRARRRFAAVAAAAGRPA